MTVHFAHILHVTEVAYLRKTKDPRYIKNRRPIGINSRTKQIPEKLLDLGPIEDIAQHWLPANQFGFVKGMSVHVVHMILGVVIKAASDRQQDLWIVYTDWTDAYTHQS